MPLDPLAILSLLVPALALTAAVVLFRRGALARHAFADAPSRAIGLGPSDLLVAIGLAFVGLFLFSAIAPRLGVVAAHPTPRQTVAVAILSQLCMHVPPLAYLVARAVLVPGGLRTIGLVPTRPGREARLGLTAFVAALPIVFTVMLAASAAASWLGRPLDPLAHDLLKLLHDERTDAAVRLGLVVSAVILAPLFEECLYRGFVQSTLVESLRGRRWLAIALTSAGFTAVHAGAVHPAAMPGLFVLALAFGWVYERSGSLLPGFVMHAAFNAFNLAMAATMPTA